MYGMESARRNRFGVQEDKLTLGEDSALPKRCQDVIVILTAASFTKAQTNKQQMELA